MNLKDLPKPIDIGEDDPPVVPAAEEEQGDENDPTYTYLLQSIELMDDVRDLLVLLAQLGGNEKVPTGKVDEIRKMARDVGQFIDAFDLWNTQTT